MSNSNGTPYADDAITVENGTKPEEVRQFVMARATSPLEVGEIVVWNFNNHVVDREALVDQADDFMHSDFVIAYQIPAVWAYMATLLPDQIREAEVLSYSRHRQTYNPYPNLIRHSDEEKDQRVTKRIAEQLREGSL